MTHKIILNIFLILFYFIKSTSSNTILLVPSSVKTTIATTTSETSSLLATLSPLSQLVSSTERTKQNITSDDSGSDSNDKINSLNEKCSNKTLSELINSSSVILKAFGGEIYHNKNIKNNYENFLLNLLPKTVYKGDNLIRKLESFQYSQYFVYDG